MSLTTILICDCCNTKEDDSFKFNNWDTFNITTPKVVLIDLNCSTGLRPKTIFDFHICPKCRNIFTHPDVKESTENKHRLMGNLGSEIIFKLLIQNK